LGVAITLIVPPWLTCDAYDVLIESPARSSNELWQKMPQKPKIVNSSAPSRVAVEVKYVVILFSFVTSACCTVQLGEYA